MAQRAIDEGDCRAASESYVVAARFSEDPKVAMRGAQLGLACHNYSSAKAAAARWRELEPYSGEAALTAALVAMKRYDVEGAREALAAWRDSGSSGGQDPLSFAEALQEEADAPLLYRLFTEVLVGDDPTAEVRLAQARLAMAAQNMEAALDAAQQAAMLDPGMLEAQTIALRALSVLGEHEAAIAGTRKLPLDELPGEATFLLADLLIGAGRTREAEAELLRLAENPRYSLGADRRLLTLAFRQNRLDLAEERLRSLVSSTGESALSVLYLAELAERRGNRRAAIQGYAVLAETPLALTARTAAARLMIKEGAKEDALRLLEEYATENPQEALEAGITRAHLLVETGDLKAALAGLDELEKSFPEHPDLDYTRATLLESAGQTRKAVAEFERALKIRPEDPQLLNALGYTLADRKQRLPDAERYIRKALEMSPDSPAIQDSMGWVLYRRGRPEEALSMLSRAWRNSSDAEIGSHFGEVLWQSGDQNQARYVWQEALNGQPDHAGLRATISRLTGEDVDTP